MKNRKELFTCVAMLIAMFLMLSADLSIAGIAINGKQQFNADAKLGLRYQSALPQKIKPGMSIKAVVVDPAKLAGFGINVKRGDVVTLVQGERSGQFSVFTPLQTKNFIADEKGILRLF